MKKRILFSLFVIGVICLNGQNHTSNEFYKKSKPLEAINKAFGQVYWEEDFDREKWNYTVIQDEYGGYRHIPDTTMPEGWKIYDKLELDYYWHWSDSGPRGNFTSENKSGNYCHYPNNNLLTLLPAETSLDNGFMLFEADFYNSSEGCNSPSGIGYHDSYIQFGPIDFSEAPGVIFNCKNLVRLCCGADVNVNLSFSSNYDSALGIGTWSSPYFLNEETSHDMITIVDERDIHINVSEDVVGHSQVYFRISFVGATHFYCIIDDIKFYEAPTHNLVIEDAWADYMYDAELPAYQVSNDYEYNFWGGYTQIPLLLTSKFVKFRAIVENEGTQVAINTKLNTLIYCDNKLLYTHNSDPINIPVYGKDTLSLYTDFTPTQLGAYQVSLTVLQDSNDIIPADNGWAYNFVVNEDTYSRVYHENAANFYGAGPADWPNGGSDGDILGQQYDIDEGISKVDLKEMNVFVDYYDESDNEDELAAIATGNMAMIGKVWVYDNAEDAIVELGIQTEFYTIKTEDIGTWVTLEFVDNGNLVVSGGESYIVGIETYTGNNNMDPTLKFQIGAEPTRYTPGKLGYFYSTESEKWFKTYDNYAIDLIIDPTISQQVTLTFNYNLSDTDDFSASEDSIYVTGSFNNWLKPGEEGSTLLTDEDGDMIYTASIKVGVNQTIEYKYFKNAGWQGGEWQGDPNRTVTIETEDVTVNDWGNWHNHLASLTFNVDMSYVDGFTVGVDEVYVAGTFNDWTEPGLEGSLLLADDDGDMIYSGVVEVEWNQTIEYKYFKNMGWSGNEAHGMDNRIIEIQESDVVVNDEFGYGHDEWPSQVTLTFNVDMNNVEGFSYERDTVYLSGSFNSWAEPGTDSTHILTDPDGDLIYTDSLYAWSNQTEIIYYRYYLNAGWDGAEWQGDSSRVVYFYGSDLIVNDYWGTTHLNPYVALVNPEIYPNPFAAELHFKYLDNVEKASICNLMGQVIETVAINGNFSLNTSNYKPGVYLVHLLDKAGNSKTFKIVKE